MKHQKFEFKRTGEGKKDIFKYVKLTNPTPKQVDTWVKFFQYGSASWKIKMKNGIVEFTLMDKPESIFNRLNKFMAWLGEGAAYAIHR